MKTRLSTRSNRSVKDVVGWAAGAEAAPFAWPNAALDKTRTAQKITLRRRDEYYYYRLY
jgi:hypothetical protein